MRRIQQLAVCLFVVALSAPALAGTGWKEKFDDICSRTSRAMEIPSEELKELLAQADRLKPEIDALEESPRKVYTRRLQMCRDLFRYVLDVREKEKQGQQEK